MHILKWCINQIKYKTTRDLYNHRGSPPPPPKKNPARVLRMRSVFVIFFPPIFLLALYFSLMMQAPPPKNIAQINRKYFSAIKICINEMVITTCTLWRGPNHNFSCNCECKMRIYIQFEWIPNNTGLYAYMYVYLFALVYNITVAVIWPKSLIRRQKPLKLNTTVGTFM